MNKFFIYLRFEATNTNLSFSGRFRNYLFKITPSQLEILTVFNSTNSDVLHNFSDSQEEIEKSKGVGLLLDLIAMSTEILTSYTSEGFIYESNATLLKGFYKKDSDFNHLYQDLQKQKHWSCGQIGEWPKIIRDGESHTFNEKRLELIKFLLNNLTTRSFYTNAQVSMLNYWRKGLVFETLYFWDECYLSYYKILEFFLESNKRKLNRINKLFRLIIGHEETVSISDAKRLLLSARLNVTDDNAQLILDLRDIRNNWDIAHPTLKKSQGNKAITQRESSYNFSYYLKLWNYWDYLKEISRLILLRNFKIDEVGLFPDGGLYKLKLK